MLPYPARRLRPLSGWVRADIDGGCDMSSRIWPSIVAVSLPPLLVSVWLAVPVLRPTPIQVTGVLQREEACLFWCASVLSVASVRVSCKADFIGLPHACPEAMRTPRETKLTYVHVPSVASVLNLAPTVGVVTRLEQDSRVVFSKSASTHVWQALYGGWVFHAIYWPIAGLVVWRWPRSRFSRKVTWQQDAK